MSPMRRVGVIEVLQEERVSVTVPRPSHRMSLRKMRHASNTLKPKEKGNKVSTKGTKMQNM